MPSAKIQRRGGGGEDKYKSKGKGGQPHVLKVGKSISRLEGGRGGKITP